VTFPKLADEGTAPSVEDVAMALRSMTTEGSVALLEMDTVPPSVPGELGL